MAVPLFLLDWITDSGQPEFDRFSFEITLWRQDCKNTNIELFLATYKFAILTLCVPSTQTGQAGFPGVVPAFNQFMCQCQKSSVDGGFNVTDGKWGQNSGGKKCRFFYTFFEKQELNNDLGWLEKWKVSLHFYAGGGYRPHVYWVCGSCKKTCTPGESSIQELPLIGFVDGDLIDVGSWEGFTVSSRNSAVFSFRSESGKPGNIPR